MFSNILVPVDGSEHAQAALLEAAELGQAVGASVTIVVAVPEPSTWIWGSAYQTTNLEQLRSELQAEYQRILDASAAQAPNAHRLLIEGPPGPAIVDQVKQGKYDLVIMGSRGRGEFSSLVLGSVSQHVLFHSGAPVLIIKEAAVRSDARAPLSARG